MNLLILGEITGQRRRGVVRDGGDLLRQRLGNIGGTWRALDAVRRKCFELGIVFPVVAAVGDKKDTALAGGVGEPADVGEQAFSAGYVELSVGQHEVGLGVDFPENYFARGHWFF